MGRRHLHRNTIQGILALSSLTLLLASAAQAQRQPLAPKRTKPRTSAPITVERRVVAVQPVAGPDLVITRVVQDPPDPLAGQSWRFAVTLRNQGTAPATIAKGSAVVAENATGSWKPLKTSTAIELAPGATRVVYKYAGVVTAGQRQVTFRVDPDDAVAERDETNNSFTASYTVVATEGKPNLTIDGVVPSTARPTVDGFDLQITVRNRGTAVANIGDATRIAFRSVGTDALSCPGAIDLAPGQARTYTCPAKRLRAGTFDWTIRVDPDGAIAESNENDNDYRLSVTIAGQAASGSDLTIASIAQDPAQPRRFTITIRNDGEATATIPAGFEIVAENSSGRWSGVTRSSTVSIAPGRTYDAIKYLSAPAGQRAITFRVDPEGVVGETVETNNDRTGTFTLP